MDFTRLFCLCNAFLSDALHVEPIAKVNGKGMFFGKLRPTEAIRFESMDGEVPYDLIGTTYGYPLVSDRLIAVLQQHGFRGWSTYPVVVRKDNGAVIHGVHGLSVTGVCGPVDFSKSAIVEVPPAVPTGEGYQARLGLYFDPATWDGSDLFVPSNTSHLIVVEPVKVALEKARVTNIEFVPLSQVEMPIV